MNKVPYIVFIIGIFFMKGWAELDMYLPPELINAGIFGSLCSNQRPNQGSCFSFTSTSFDNEDSYKFCSQVCHGERPPRCSTDHDEVQPQCTGPSQTFVCGYEDAVVCTVSNGRGTCLHRSKTNGGELESHCACKTVGTDVWSSELHSSCSSYDLDIVSLAVACCLAVVLIILVVIIGCCFCKRGLSCQRAKTRSSSPESKELGPRGSDSEAKVTNHQAPESLEYSYAYGHASRAPIDDPELAEGPDLDELQEDHYYSRLKTAGGDEKGTNGKVSGKSGTRPESGHEDSLKSTGDGKVQQGKETQDQSSGYEVARVRRPGDVTPEPSNRGSPEEEARPNVRDSGYEVATVKPAEDDKRHSYVTLEPTTEKRDSGYEIATVKPVDDDKRHSYFTLEKPAENEKPVDDSGYEKVTKLNQQEVEGVDDTLSAYDHLQRPGPDLSTEGANSKM